MRLIDVILSNTTVRILLVNLAALGVNKLTVNIHPGPLISYNVPFNSFPSVRVRLKILLHLKPDHLLMGTALAVNGFSYRKVTTKNNIAKNGFQTKESLYPL